MTWRNDDYHGDDKGGVCSSKLPPSHLGHNEI